MFEVPQMQKFTMISYIFKHYIGMKIHWNFLSVLYYMIEFCDFLIEHYILAL